MRPFDYHRASNPSDVAGAAGKGAAIIAGGTNLLDLMKLDDSQLLDVLSVAREYGAMTMVHAENNDIIKWLSQRLLERGHTAPKFHAMSHARIAETEASNRAASSAELPDRIAASSPFNAVAESFTSAFSPL